MPEPIIVVEDLTKTFPGNVTAVNRVSFTVDEGEVFGFLGPNGAGKSTTIMILTTLLRPTSGRAAINGYDVVRQPDAVRRSIGYVAQDLSSDDNLTGRENLALQAGFYHLPRREARRRIAEVLDLVGLAERADHLVETYSGGMRKRLDIAAGLIHRPRVLFLDEPTLGLDIQTRRQIWQYVADLRREVNMTIFLTTHYMEEADNLCDRIGIIDRGEIRAIDRPAALKARIGGDLVTLRLAGGKQSVEEAAKVITNLPQVRHLDRRGGGNEFMAVVSDGEHVVPSLFEACQPTGARIVAVTVKRPSLDDVYLAFTGRDLRDETGSREKAMRTRMIMRRVRSR
ncbi:MAG: ATP-binding cassette domain-containing protein [Bacillota bacterium]|nr:ATP-binding cassette domain-containing protein [Bacillota bacterium]